MTAVAPTNDSLPLYDPADYPLTAQPAPLWSDRIDWTDSSDAELVETLDRAELWSAPVATCSWCGSWMPNGRSCPLPRCPGFQGCRLR